MKLVRVDFHNFRSCCEKSNPCSLKVAHEITFLLGASESGKSNLLEAMSKFEVGNFTIEDVPRSQLSPAVSTPPDDLPMISVTYELDESERNSILENQKVYLTQLTYSRSYRGPIRILSDGLPDTKSISSVAQEMFETAQNLKGPLSRFFRSYSRTRRNIGATEAGLTTTCTFRMNRFLDVALDTDAATRDGWGEEASRLFNRLRRAVTELDVTVMAQVPVRTKVSAIEILEAMRALIQQLVEQTNGNSASTDLFKMRPVFRLVVSDSTEWLSGEYNLDDLITGNGPGLASARRLLNLARLDLEALKTAAPYMVPDLLREASETASKRLQEVWLQDKLSIKIEMSTGGIEGLVIYVSSRDHNGLPNQRSYGFRWFLEFLLSYAESQSSQGSSILLFDEPGIYLHPEGQYDLLQLIKNDIVPNNQVVLTTHLPGMIDLTAPDSLRGVVKSEVGHGTEILNDGYSPTHKKTTWEVMQRAIGLHGPNGYGPGRTVVLEGTSDMQYLLAMAKLLVPNDERATEIASGHVRLYAGHGAHEMKVICPHLIGNMSTIAVLLDSDNEGNIVRDHLQERYHPPVQYFRQIIMINDPEYDDNYFSLDGDSEHEIEDLFGAQLYAEMVNLVFGPLLTGGHQFELLPQEVAPSKSKKAAQEWLAATGQFDKLDIYQVAASFSDLIRQQKITIPQDVKSRFGQLLGHLTQATLPE